MTKLPRVLSVGAKLGAIGPYDLGLGWTDMNRPAVHDLHGELV